MGLEKLMVIVTAPSISPVGELCTSRSALPSPPPDPQATARAENTATTHEFTDARITFSLYAEGGQTIPATIRRRIVPGSDPARSLAVGEKAV
jgi:hypothetical protein